MKNFKLIITACAMIIAFIFTAKAQGNKTETIKIKTSAICGMCQETIETALAYEKGIKKSSLDVDTKIVTVIYKPAKTTPEKIRKVISLSGYDADDVKADPKAYKNLDECCKDASKCEEVNK